MKKKNDNDEAKRHYGTEYMKINDGMGCDAIVHTIEKESSFLVLSSCSSFYSPYAMYGIVICLFYFLFSPSFPSSLSS